MSWRLLDHTGDVAVEVTAGSAEELFAQAAAAMTDCVTEVEGVEAREERSLAVGAGDLELLMVEWLGELLYVFETERFLAAEAEVELEREEGRVSLRAVARGEAYDRERHPLKVAIKGVTYHALEVVAENGWRARVVFDI